MLLSLAQLRLGLFQRCGQQGNDFCIIPDNPNIGILEHRRFLVFVNRDNGARSTNADYMFKRTANTNREVELGGNRSSSQTDLVVVSGASPYLLYRG